jgi:hypothetical protein
LDDLCELCGIFQGDGGDAYDKGKHQDGRGGQGGDEVAVMAMSGSVSGGMGGGGGGGGGLGDPELFQGPLVTVALRRQVAQLLGDAYVGKHHDRIILVILLLSKGVISVGNTHDISPLTSHPLTPHLLSPHLPHPAPHLFAGENG